MYISGVSMGAGGGNTSMVDVENLVSKVKQLQQEKTI